jgi:GAF domain-containing protein
MVSTFADQAALALQQAKSQSAQRELEIMAVVTGSRAISTTT